MIFRFIVVFRFLFRFGKGFFFLHSHGFYWKKYTQVVTSEYSHHKDPKEGSLSCSLSAFENCTCQLFSMADCLQLKAVAEIKGTDLLDTLI